MEREHDVLDDYEPHISLTHDVVERLHDVVMSLRLRPDEQGPDAKCIDSGYPLVCVGCDTIPMYLAISSWRYLRDGEPEASKEELHKLARTISALRCARIVQGRVREAMGGDVDLDDLFSSAVIISSGKSQSDPLDGIPSDWDNACRRAD